MEYYMKRSRCPICDDSGNDNLVHHADGAYCHGCGYKEHNKNGKGTIVEAVSKKKCKLSSPGEVIGLKKRNITLETCQKFNVSVDLRRNVSIFPHYSDKSVLVAQKIKTPDKKIYWEGEPSKSSYFGEQSHNGHRDVIVVTEGEEDCLAVSQVVGDYIHCTSLTNGAQDVEKFVKLHYKKLSEYNKIILSFDMDVPGRNAVDKFKSNFPIGKVAVVSLPRKDASDMLSFGEGEKLKWAVLKAPIDRPDGVCKVGELSLDFFEEKIEKGIDLPYPLLNHCLGGLRKGELTMLAAGTGLGKSTWTTNLVQHLIVKKGLTVVDMKLEENQRKTIYHYMALENKKHFRKFREDTDIISKEDKKKFLKKYENLYVHNHFGSLDSKELLNVLDFYATVLKVDFIVLDHISIVISGNDGGMDGERKQIDKLVTKIRELIERTGTGFICVSHLRNPPNDQTQWEEGRKIRRLDLRGSGALAQLSDNIIGLEGDLTQVATKNDRIIRLIKTRYGEEQEAYCDTYTWDSELGCIVLKKGNTL